MEISRVLEFEIRTPMEISNPMEISMILEFEIRTPMEISMAHGKFHAVTKV